MHIPNQHVAYILSHRTLRVQIQQFFTVIPTLLQIELSRRCLIRDKMSTLECRNVCIKTSQALLDLRQALSNELRGSDSYCILIFNPRLLIYINKHIDNIRSTLWNIILIGNVNDCGLLVVKVSREVFLNSHSHIIKRRTHNFDRLDILEDKGAIVCCRSNHHIAYRGIDNSVDAPLNFRLVIFYNATVSFPLKICHDERTVSFKRQLKARCLISGKTHETNLYGQRLSIEFYRLKGTFQKIGHIKT